MPEPSNKELPDILDLIISSEKRKEHDEEDDRAVKRLRALLAQTKAEVYGLVC